MDKRKVLFVDDDNFIQASGKALMTVSKLSFVIAKNGNEAIQEFSNGGGSFTTLFIDIHMPDKDGYQTCKEIRAIESSKGFPKSKIVAMSGGSPLFYGMMVTNGKWPIEFERNRQRCKNSGRIKERWI